MDKPLASSLRSSLIFLFSLSFPISITAEQCTDAPVNGQLYSIANKSSGAVLDVAAYSKEPEANILSWRYQQSENQHFYLHQLDNGYWTIQSQLSGMNLDVFQFSQSSGANIIQWHPSNTVNQQWSLQPKGDGSFAIVARHSGKVITVAGSNNGANIYQNNDMGNVSQRWHFNPVDSACGAQQVVSGFASMPGGDGLATTTGGGSAASVKIESCDQLANLADSDQPRVLLLPNRALDCRTSARAQPVCEISCPSYQDPGKSIFRIPVGNQRCTDLGSHTDATITKSRNERKVRVGSNTTIVGLGKDSRVRGVNFDLSGSQNIILRNFQIDDVNPELVEAGDGVTLNNSTHIVLDHLRFRLISDGHVDIHDSQNVTLSWNRFDGYNAAVCGNQHHYTNLAYNSQVTFHHNFWNHTSGRNPKLVGPATRAHLFNNLWKNIPYFAVSVSQGAQAKLEANYFENASKPHWNEGDGFIDGGNDSNEYRGSSSRSAYRHTGNDWVLNDIAWYVFSPEPAIDIPPVLDQKTGPQAN
ncbi:RICIN domain-containing protein [Pleionea litopenaei]|uniref:pectin lyase n=1 Tax=Pleionea litopenaei TaxID=3070815 RepID=A0AA51RT06_9GAMM|nr:RICIN domain-containing protein [Pleionea sp. HL-JVS1]WMS87032.1 RICIN domain-containing protein [Pleionea sp. HL-JVS1]